MEEVDNSAQKNRKSSILGIFAKQPVPGKCKTRLCPPLSFQEAAKLYCCALMETYTRMQQLPAPELVICYAGERHWFEQQFPGANLLPQEGEDLGARMANALASFLSQGYRQAVLIGSDAPDLPLSLVSQAFAELERVEIVLAPAADGGYVLIGESVHRPELFNQIEWSTAEVLPETRRRIKSAEIKAVELPGWEDIDDARTLEKFLQRSPDTQTANFLRRHLANSV